MFNWWPLVNIPIHKKTTPTPLSMRVVSDITKRGLGLSIDRCRSSTASIPNVLGLTGVLFNWWPVLVSGFPFRFCRELFGRYVPTCGSAPRFHQCFILPLSYCSLRGTFYNMAFLILVSKPPPLLGLAKSKHIK